MSRGRPGFANLSFYLVAVGAAVGLGNIWRFPYVVAENGGGAFVLLYLFLVFIVGMPVLIGELLLGKATGSALIPALQQVKAQRQDLTTTEVRIKRVPDRFLVSAGVLAVGICLVVLGYYAVISGWVLHFLVHFLVGSLRQGAIDSQESLSSLFSQGWLQLILASGHLVLVSVIVAREIDEGIERWVGQIMPVFLVLLGILAYQALSLENSGDALRFFFYPDFSRLSWSSLAQALGQVLFTLSLGFGTMVTFGSYLGQRTNVAISGYWVALFDVVISLIAGLMVFPVVINQVTVYAGPQLVFYAVPDLFNKVAGGAIFGLGFFICLYLAALGASISLLETVVANLRETTKLKRAPATFLVAGLALVLAILPALSSNLFTEMRWAGRGLLEWLDAILIDWLLPLSALLVSQLIVRRLDTAVPKAEFEYETNPSVAKMYGHWRFALRYLVPLVVVGALTLQLIGLIRGGGS